MSKPIAIIVIPAMRFNQPLPRPILATCLSKNSIKKAVIKKGRAIPIEYTKSIFTPSATFRLSIAVEAKIAPKIGPKHGVHPNAKPIPRAMAVMKLTSRLTLFFLWSFDRKGMVTQPVILSPKKAIMNPLSFERMPL